MSTDKDFLQLANGRIKIWSPTKKKMYDEDAVLDEFGISSHNLIWYRVIDGDKSDNIPGVYGCGIKTLVKRFPEITEEKKLSIDDLFKLCETKIEETKGKIKIYKDILKSKKQILLNEDLMQLDNVDISGQVKLKVLEKYDENDIVINKMDFMKILLKYKVVNNFGNINDWLKSTFGNIISK